MNIRETVIKQAFGQGGNFILLVVMLYAAYLLGIEFIDVYKQMRILEIEAINKLTESNESIRLEIIQLCGTEKIAWQPKP